METIYSKPQTDMLLESLKKGAGEYGYGYAPCGRGITKTMLWLHAAGLVTLTGSQYSIDRGHPRGVILTAKGEEVARKLAAS
jgi:hypothetical protein